MIDQVIVPLGYPRVLLSHIWMTILETQLVINRKIKRKSSWRSLSQVKIFFIARALKRDLKIQNARD